MESTTSGACAVVRHRTNQIYFVGGDVSSTLFSTATQIFDIDKRMFLPSISSQLREAKQKIACMIFEENETLIAAGGETAPGYKDTNTVEVLNLITEAWSNLRPMPCTCKLWNLGGSIFLRDTKLYQYDPKYDRWWEIDYLPFNVDDLDYGFQVIQAGAGKTCTFN